MIENWNQASEEEQRFVLREAVWQLVFCVTAFLCILPLGALGIWQSYDIYAIYEKGGISLGFIITGVLCGVVILLSILFLHSSWKNYRENRGEELYRSNEGRVERTWQEKENNTITEYFSFSYKDIVTGQVAEYKSMNYGRGRMKEGDALCVLAHKRQDALEIADVSKQQEKKKLSAFWLVMDVAILAVVFLAWLFLFLNFGVAAIYIRLGCYLSLIAVTVLTLFYGIFERKAGAVLTAVLLCGVMFVIALPQGIKNISLDITEGPRESEAYISSYERENVTRTRKGRRRTRHYYLDISSRETDIREVEVTKAARDYYKSQYGARVASGKLIYYPHTKIFLYWLGEKKEE